VDLSKLTPGDYLMGGGGLIFIIALLLPWYGISGYSDNGLDYFFWGIFPFFLIVAAVVLAVLDFSDVDLPTLPVPWSLVSLGLAGFATLLVLLKILIGEEVGSGTVFGESFTVELDRKFGIFIAFLAAGAVTAGAAVKLVQSGGLNDLTGKGGGFPPNPPGGQGPYGGPPQQPPYGQQPQPPQPGYGQPPQGPPQAPPPGYQQPPPGYGQPPQGPPPQGPQAF
jgi:hypothetical protein